MISRMVKYIEASLYKRRINPIAHVLLLVLSYAYGIVVGIRNYCYYGAGLCKRTKMQVPVVSVGNITVGGSGKTPLAIHLAALLKKNNVKSVILTRGYKSTGNGVSVLTKDNLEEASREPELYGDEPLLMARRLYGTPVLVSPDRVLSAEHAIKNFSPDIILLDDGFQHARLWRDLDIVLLDGRRGIGSGHLLPRGPLREPVDALKRADIILIKGGGTEASGIAAKYNKPTVTFSYRPVCLVGRNGEERDVSFIDDKKVVMLSAIADPESFESTLKGIGADVTEKIVFSDHHWFRAPDIEKIKHMSKGADIIVTTEKDAVRLYPYSLDNVPIYALKVELVIDDMALIGEILKVTKRRASASRG